MIENMLDLKNILNKIPDDILSDFNIFKDSDNDVYLSSKKDDEHRLSLFDKYQELHELNKLILNIVSAVRNDEYNNEVITSRWL